MHTTPAGSGSFRLYVKDGTLDAVFQAIVADLIRLQTEGFPVACFILVQAFFCYS